jgi:ATP-dependent DNA helicase PIF1
MLSGELFDKVEYIARKVRGSEEPFGGIQLILVGDFFQLPPVNQNGKELDFCFESKSWDKVIESSFELRKIFRQNDQEFITILNEIRVGIVTKKCEEILKKCENRKFDDK